MNDSDIEIRLTTRLDDLRGDMRRAEQVVGDSLSGMRRQFDGFSAQLRTMQNLIVGSGLVLLGKQAVGVMSNFEQLEIRLTGVMGSVADGEKAFDWIKDFAASTPYQVDQVAEAFIRLKAFGLDPMDGSMQAIADTAAKIGGDYETLEGVVLALGQAWAKQKLQGEEILQLVERGVPVWDTLEKVTGKNTAELQQLSEQGKLGRDVIAALIDELGRANEGSTTALMESLSGGVSNLVDNLKGSLDDVRQAGGLDGLKRDLAEINDWFEQNRQSGASQEWARNTAQLINQLNDAAHELLDMLLDLSSIGSEALAAVGAMATDSASEQEQAFSAVGAALETLRVLLVGFRTAIQLVWQIAKSSAANAVAGIKGVMIDWGEQWDVAGEHISSWLTRLGIRLNSFGETAKKALRGDFSGAAENWREATAQIEAEIAASEQRIAAIKEKAATERAINDTAQALIQSEGRQAVFDIAQDGNDRIYRRGKYDPLQLDSSAGATSGGSQGGGIAKTGSTSVVVGDNKTSVSGFNAELNALKAKFQLENQLRQLSIADEIAFWQQKQGLVEMGSNEETAIRQKILQLQVRQAQEARDQQLAVDEASRQAHQRLAEERLKTAEQTAQMERDLGLIGQGEYLRRLAEFEAQRYEMARTALEERLALLALEADANQAEIIRVQGELEVLLEQHEQRKAEIRAQAAQESTSLWTELGDSMSNLWNQGLEAMLNGTLTWKNAMNAIYAEVGRVFLQQVVSEPLKKWAAAQASKLAMQLGFIKTEQAAETAAASQSLATSAQVAMGKLGNSAAAAAGGAAESQASIPYVGPILAVAAMGAMLTAVMGMKANIKSARGGYDIPAGINPVTQLHEEEMVLPAEHANTIRRLGEEGGGGGDSLPPVAFPGKRMGNMYLMELPDLAKAIKELHRRNMIR